jgi:hypothetical protein
MTKAIGPTFVAELLAAGVDITRPFSWSSDGSLNLSRLTAAEQTAVDAVYAAHDPAKPDPAQLFAMAIAAGCRISSAATPALNGTYAIDDAAQQTITGIAAGIAARNRVPGGGATFTYPDMAGTLHAFSAADFLDFATAVEDYVYALSNGQTPAQPVQIA